MLRSVPARHLPAVPTHVLTQVLTQQLFRLLWKLKGPPAAWESLRQLRRRGRFQQHYVQLQKAAQGSTQQLSFQAAELQVCVSLPAP